MGHLTLTDVIPQRPSSELKQQPCGDSSPALMSPPAGSAVSESLHTHLKSTARIHWRLLSSVDRSQLLPLFLFFFLQSPQVSWGLKLSIRVYSLFDGDSDTFLQG